MRRCGVGKGRAGYSQQNVLHDQCPRLCPGHPHLSPHLASIILPAHSPGSIQCGQSIL